MMIDRTKLKGIVPPLVTPLLADGQTVNESGVHQLVERVVGQGVHGVFVAGTTGEIYGLEENQWERLVRFSVEACRGRVPLYVGVSSAATSLAVSRARRAEKLGADVLVSLAPYYVPPSQSEVVNHFEALAGATGLPVIVYQFPGISKVSINLETYQTLAKIPNLVGIKDSQADVTVFRQMVAVLRANGQDFRLLLGSDTLTDVVVLLGAQGTVPAMGNIAAAWLVEAYESAVRGDWAASAAAQAKVNRLRALYAVAGKESSFRGMFAGLKCALQLLGIDAGPTVLPMLPCNREETKAIQALLTEHRLLV
jgi:4-hydroxy-tetrahydrodipicolinate synthase